MDTIKYYNLFILCIIIISSVSASLKIKEPFASNISRFNDVAIPKNVYYRELTSAEMNALLFQIPLLTNINVKKYSPTELKTQSVEYAQRQVEKMLINHLQMLGYNFYVVKAFYRGATIYESEYLVSFDLLVYREGKMYGFLLEVTAALSASKRFAGFVSVMIKDTILEDKIHLLPGPTNSIFRDYHESSAQFNEDERIVQDNEYENDVFQRQQYGLLKDMGISMQSIK